MLADRDLKGKRVADDGRIFFARNHKIETIFVTNQFGVGAKKHER